jgi:hypothetical protein
MALLDDVLKVGAPAILVGVGAVLVAPLVLPAVGSVARPLAKGAVKGYLALADSAKEMFAEASEQWSDLVAEARAEHSEGAPAAASHRAAAKGAAKA